MDGVMSMKDRPDSATPWNRRSFRRVLIDMHTPDWDPRFLARYDPAQVRKVCQEVQATGVMIYFQSHVGLCYWPTRAGQMHKRFEGRDLMAETLREFKKAGLPVCAYYSVNYDNWAYLHHPKWRFKPAAVGGTGILPRERYGIVCFNNPEYRAYVHAQAAEIVQGYDIDAFFFDMLWWSGICLCSHCEDRARRETGADIPKTVDWLDPAWCRFQAARERWLTEFVGELRDNVHRHRPDLQVYHNFALGMADWARGVSLESAAHHDFLGGDFYGGRDEQLVITRLMLNLSESRPVEFMTTVAANLIEHDHHQPTEELQLKGYAAVACASAYLLIAAVNPDGTISQAMKDRLKASFSGMIPYESYLGGEAVEDIAVYFSGESKMDFADNGKSINAILPSSSAQYPHAHGVMGACRILQEAHLPFGVITRKQLRSLHRYKVIILPNVLRMTAEEVDAFRAYVRGGGRLYASRYTSLTEVAGTRHDDFMLSDVFGCQYQGDELCKVIYLNPVADELRTIIAPDTLATHRYTAGNPAGSVRLAKEYTGRPLATLTLPYGYPFGGAVGDQKWAAIHTSPAWDNTDRPLIIDNDYGKGRSIYSAADIEAGGSEVHDKLFLALIRSLLGGAPSFAAEIHPAVWMTVFDQAEAKRRIVSFLNYQSALPIIPIPHGQFRLSPPEKQRFRRLVRLPDGKEVACRIDDAGNLSAAIADLGHFSMFAAEYA